MGTLRTSILALARLEPPQHGNLKNFNSDTGQSGTTTTWEPQELQ